jgi:hypothetical protein
MRALMLTTVLLTLFGLYPLLAQDERRPSPSASQPAQPDANPNAPAKQDSELTDED